MASKKTVNAENLENLGAARLAELLVEIGAGDPAIKRRLRMALADADGSGELSQEIRKRITAIAGSKSFVEWDRVQGLAEDLDTQRRAIAGQIAGSDPAEALDLMFRFMDLAGSVYERCDDSNGEVGGVFDLACQDIGAIATEARPGPAGLADRVCDALLANDYGQYDGLIAATAPALGNEGLERLKQRLLDLRRRPEEKPDDDGEREVLGWSPRTGEVIYADQARESFRASTIRTALQEIADAQGDVDAYIGQYDDQARKNPKTAAELSSRLLAAGRPGEALEILDAADVPGSDDRGYWYTSWADARIDVLEALGRGGEAQRLRWEVFERTLSPDHLRAHLGKLPEFEDQEVESKALDHAQSHSRSGLALWFLATWPALGRAARLVEDRAGEMDGNQYELLTPAADTLADKHPLAATILLRAMVDFTLENARSTRYRHAARNLMECATLSEAVEAAGGFGKFETHGAFEARLREEHGRKRSFWAMVD